MRKQYINYPSNLPVNISYYNIHNYPTHWHNSTEIIYVLEGSINISIDTDSFTLKENEVKGFVLTCKDHLIPFYESCGFRFKGVSKSVHGNAKWNDMVRINERER